MPALTPDDLAAAGRALFGERFSAADLGDALGINERNMRYWLAGRSGPRDPDEVRWRLCELLTARIALVQDARRRLR